MKLIISSKFKNKPIEEHCNIVINMDNVDFFIAPEKEQAIIFYFGNEEIIWEYESNMQQGAAFEELLEYLENL